MPIGSRDQAAVDLRSEQRSTKTWPGSVATRMGSNVDGGPDRVVDAVQDPGGDEHAAAGPGRDLPLLSGGGAVPGMPGTPGSPATGVAPTDVDALLDGAVVLGLELDPKYRVLAATFELTAARHPDGEADDRRIQVLCHPVSTFMVAVQQRTPEGTVVLEFPAEQLVDVVAAFDEPPVSTPIFGRPEPRPGSLAPTLSLQGRSTAGDGTRATMLLHLAHEDLTLDLFARFDEVEVKRPDSSALFR